jgi:CRP-like cAMP-binding protein
MSQDEILQALSRSTLLREVSPASREILADYFELLDGERGNRLFSEGDREAALYIVIEGQLEARIDSGTGLETGVQRFGPGDSIGAFSLLLRGERLVSVDALTTCRLVELRLDAFRMLRQQSPDACLHLVLAIVRHMGRVLEEGRSPLKRMLIRYANGLDTL